MDTHNKNMTHDDTCFCFHFTSSFRTTLFQTDTLPVPWGAIIFQEWRYDEDTAGRFNAQYDDTIIFQEWWCHGGKTLPAGWTLPNCKQWLAPHRDAAASNPFICIPSMSVAFFTSHFESSTHLVCNISLIWKVLKNSWKGHISLIRKYQTFSRNISNINQTSFT